MAAVVLSASAGWAGGGGQLQGANTAARQAGRTTKRYQGLDGPPRYASPTLTYPLGHDSSVKTAQRVSILTLDGRVIVSYVGYARHVARLQHGIQPGAAIGVSIGAAKLW